MTACAHDRAEIVLNAAGEPVRLLCPCGREWRVVPIEWDVQILPERPP
jgi:hypothetical protein